jgi:hypothetical protein
MFYNAVVSPNYVVCVESNGRMADKCWFGKDVTGSGCDVIEALYHHTCVTELKEPTKNLSISLPRQSIEPGACTALILLYHAWSGRVIGNRFGYGMPKAIFVHLLFHL